MTPVPSTQRRPPLVALLIGLALLAAACGGGSEASGGSGGDTAPAGGDAAADAGGTTELTLGLVVDKTFETAMVPRSAKAQGFFEEEGLDVEIIAFQGGADLVKGMAAGAAQIGAATGFDPPAAVAKGVPLQAFAGVAELSPMVVIAGADSGITDTAGLCDADVGITRFGSLTDFVVRTIAAQEGCEITPVPLGGAAEQTAALTQGETDAFVWSTEVGLQLEDEGQGTIVARFADILEQDQYAVLMAAPDYLEANEDTVERFLRAYFRGAQWMRDNPEEAIAFTAETLQLPEDVAASTYEELMGHISEDGAMNTAGLENLASQLPDLEIAETVPPLDDYYTDQFVPVES